MNLEDLRQYCLSKNGTSEDMPFGENTLVFRVVNKLFALTSFSSQPAAVNLKCDPEKAAQLRDEYPCVQPGFHMNKKHWNTVVFDGSVNDALIKQWIDHSYDLVVASLSKTNKATLESNNN